MSHARVFEAGAMEGWKRWEFAHPALPKPARGKLMLGEKLGLSGMEVSLNSLPPGVAMPFAHTHRECEELYLFLRGRGEFKVDDQVFPVQPGTCIQVAPAGSRSWRSAADEPLVYVVIQASARGSVRGIDDGAISEAPVKWPSQAERPAFPQSE